MAPLRAPRAGAGRRQAGADPDQPRPRSTASTASTSTSTRWRRSSPAAPSRCATIRTSEDVVVSRVGRELYEKFFRGYTRKQWGLDPSELDKSRDRARADPHQPRRPLLHRQLPGDAAARLHAHVREHARPSEHQDHAQHRLSTRSRARSATTELIFTGPDRRVLRLPLRQAALPLAALRARDAGPANGSSRSRWSTTPTTSVPYTRVTEYKHLTGQQHAEDQRHLRVPGGRGRPLLPGAAAGERRALPQVPGAGRPRRRTSTSSAGWPPTATTTWTRWSGRRWPSTPSCAPRQRRAAGRRGAGRGAGADGRRTLPARRVAAAMAAVGAGATATDRAGMTIARAGLFDSFFIGGLRVLDPPPARRPAARPAGRDRARPARARRTIGGRRARAAHRPRRAALAPDRDRARALRLVELPADAAGSARGRACRSSGTCATTAGPTTSTSGTPDFVDRFARFAAAAAARGPRRRPTQVPFYCPVNEISFWAWAGGTWRKFNPLARGRGGELKRQLVRAAIAGDRGDRGPSTRARASSRSTR